MGTQDEQPDMHRDGPILEWGPNKPMDDDDEEDNDYDWYHDDDDNDGDDNYKNDGTPVQQPNDFEEAQEAQMEGPSHGNEQHEFNEDINNEQEHHEQQETVENKERDLEDEETINNNANNEPKSAERRSVEENNHDVEDIHDDNRMKQCPQMLMTLKMNPGATICMETGSKPMITNSLSFRPLER